MKILLVHYNPNAGGGAESALRDQTEALRRLGHTVELELVHPERGYARVRPDAVHFHTVHCAWGLAPLTWAQKAGIPHCISLHDYWPFCESRMLLAEYDRPCAAVTGLCDGKCAGKPQTQKWRATVNQTPTVCFNPYSAAILKRHGIRVDAVIPHGIDTDFFSPDSAQRTGIVTTSAWASYPTKGMHVLRAALRELGVGARLITGVSRSVVRDELRRGAIYVFPSCYEETWGLGLTEAMACGMACVASDVCGPRAQIEHGVNGLLVPPRDPTALAAALRQLLGDASLREKLGASARAWAVANANLERMGRDYVAFYGRLLGGTAKCGGAARAVA